MYASFVPYAAPTLSSFGQMDLRRGKAFDARRFFKSDRSMTVSHDFERDILTKARKTLSAGSAIIERHRLRCAVGEGQLAEALTGSLVHDETRACCIIAHLIEEQKAGRLPGWDNLNAAHLFYTKDRVIVVRWQMEWNEGRFEQRCFVTSFWRNFLYLGKGDFVVTCVQDTFH